MKNFITLATTDEDGCISRGNHTIHVDFVGDYRRMQNGVTEVELKSGRFIYARNSPGSIDTMIEEAQS